MHADPTPIAADMDRDRLDGLSGQIIGAAHRVSSNLGYGFLEKVYQNSLLIELENKGLFVEQQRPVQVLYQGTVVGDYIPDLVVEQSIVVEVKAITGLERIHRQQCINYLRATGYRVCLLLNFGQPRFEMKRLVWKF
jgi:GxxExxY protein